jgi:hypothetical protein
VAKRKKASFRKPNCGLQSSLKIRIKGFSRSKFEYLEGIVQGRVQLYAGTGALEAVIYTFCCDQVSQQGPQKTIIEFDKKSAHNK